MIRPLKIIKNWFRNTRTRENNWDEIRDKIVEWSLFVQKYFNQVGLDINGSSYEFNDNGTATQTTSIVSRLTTLENTAGIVGTRNIGFDFSVSGAITLRGSDGSNLSSTNAGLVTFNETATGGDLVTREITSNITLTFTGAHWGFDTFGDLTDQK